jgi:clorobiocin/coumermycin A biosynthesis protein CloN6/CouN6
MASQLAAHLLLLQAPSVYDSRQRDNTLFACLSDSVNVNSVSEMYPIRFLVRQHQGHPQDPGQNDNDLIIDETRQLLG